MTVFWELKKLEFCFGTLADISIGGFSSGCCR